MATKRIVVIGSCALEIIIDGATPKGLEPDGRMLTTAVELARMGMPVSFVSEAARDRVGDLIVESLRSEGVDVSSIDRYIGGHTPLNLTFNPDAGHPDRPETVHYRAYPPTEFDAIWPRIGRDDIVVIGDYFAVGPRNSRFIREFVANARQSRAIVVYAPGFRIHAGKQLTTVKPALLDTLEWADFVVANEREMADFFGAADLVAAYRNNVSFYCPNFIGVSADDVTFFGLRDSVTEKLPAAVDGTTRRGVGRIVAAVARGLATAGVTRQEVLEGITEERRAAILAAMDLASLTD